MFTGIVRELGRVQAVENGQTVRLRLEAPATAGNVVVGDSVSLNGVCLTATEVSDGVLTFDAVQETLRRSTLGRLEAGAGVNVEPALRAGEPLGGHLVQGHVDGVGQVVEVAPGTDGAAWVTIRVPKDLRRYLVDKGSVCVDGVSLTVAALDGDTFAVALIPPTLSATTLGSARPNDPVNLEVDVIAKYVHALLEGRDA